MKVIYFDPYRSELDYEEAVVASKIVRFSKRRSGSGEEVTVIHLDNGEELETKDSIKTLKARVESEV